MAIWTSDILLYSFVPSFVCHNGHIHSIIYGSASLKGVARVCANAAQYVSQCSKKRLIDLKKAFDNEDVICPVDNIIITCTCSDIISMY